MSEPKTWREWVEFLNPLRLASGEEAFRERDACAAFLEGHVAELRARAETDEKILFRVRRPRAGRATLPDLEALGAEVTFVSQSVEGILITQVVEARLGELSEEGTGMFACGPRAMLARLSEVTGGHIPLQVSLEERMACGVGACRSCVVPMRSAEDAAYKTVCRDGPVFDAAEVDWERLTP